jgi:hypothetical protein
MGRGLFTPCRANERDCGNSRIGDHGHDINCEIESLAFLDSFFRTLAARSSTIFFLGFQWFTSDTLVYRQFTKEEKTPLRQSGVLMNGRSFAIMKASEYKLPKEFAIRNTAIGERHHHERAVFKKDLFLPSAKIGIVESRLRLFLEAEISGEVTAICRSISRSGPDPILFELLRDDVVSFSTRFELNPQSEIAVSGFSVKPLVAAVLCRARGIADHNQGESDSRTRISAAKAAALNDDLLLFRRIAAPEMPAADLAEVSDFVIKMGRKAIMSRELICKTPVSAVEAASQ